MEFAKRHKDEIIKLYEKGWSSYQIAEHLNTYSTKILRALTYLGVEKRDYSEAQLQALKKGRSKHPTKGKKLKDSHKAKIGIGRAKTWSNMSDEEKERISNLSKERWKNMTQAEKDNLSKLALEAVRVASKEGSKTEKHLRNALEEKGWKVEFHKHLSAQSKLEVDLFLPEFKIVIEIDGPGHFLPIWGEDKLKKQQKADIIKQGLLLNYDYALLRVRQVDKSISLTRMNSLIAIVIEEVEKIRESFPEKGQRLIEIEVKNGESRRI